MIRLSVLLLVFLHAVNTCRCFDCTTPLSGTTSDPAHFTGPFDYLIIGGGTAGLVLASRLTDDENIRVGVIEAGFYHGNNPLIDVPGNTGKALGNPDYDWKFISTSTAGADNREISIPRGKMVGGSTGLNNLAWTRASQDEYDAWQTLTGDPQWSWNGLLPYLRKVESVSMDERFKLPQTSSASYDPEFVNFDGPVKASFSRWYSDPFPLYQESYRSLGVPINTSPDNGTTSGIVNCRSDVSRPASTRAYAALAYYCRFGSRPNFHVLTNAQVLKVLLLDSKAGFIATGVQYSTEGKTHVVNATREVILSAGSLQTPQLLELSGIGNKTLLSNVGIMPLIDLPEVGENLQDHLFSAAQFSVKPGIITFDELRTNTTYFAEQQSVYNETGGGPLSGTDTALAFLPFDMFLDAAQIANLRVQFEEAVAQSPQSPLRTAQFNIQRKWLENGKVPQTETIMWSKGIIDPAPNQSYITVLSGGLHHVFRGSVHINTMDALTQPEINLNWLSNDYDISTIALISSFSQRVPSLAPLSNIIVDQTAPPLEMRNGTGFASYLRQAVASASHPMGTVPMARQELGGVLDSELRVYGTKNLRVCDASIFPIGIGTHLQSTVYAVAEKLSDIIKQSVRSGESAVRKES